jgi:hypothetical protein
MTVVSDINKFIGTLFPGSLSFPVRKFVEWLPQRKINFTFTSLILNQFNPLIIFVGDFFKLFNIKQDYTQLLVSLGNQTVAIVFDSNEGNSFEVLDRVQFCFHSSFSDTKYNYLSQNNESCTS